METRVTLAELFNVGVEGRNLSEEASFSVFIIKVCGNSLMMRLHSSLLNQHRPGTSDKNIVGKQIIKPLPDKTWKGKWCVLADGVCSPPHWCPYLPTARVESLRALSLWNPPSVYLCHALRVLGIISSFVPFPEFPFSPASKEFSPHTHTNAIRVHISLQREQIQPFLSLDSTHQGEYLLRCSFLWPFQASIGPDGRTN